MPGTTQTMPIPELTQEEKELSALLRSDVFALADSIGERNVFTPGSMEATVDWLTKRFSETGYKPQVHSYNTTEMYHSRVETPSQNVIAEIEGTAEPQKLFIIGAHYDSVRGSPGGNDNASAVAVLIALADYFFDHPQSQTIRFVAFANEEPPFFKTQHMGSYAYASHLTGQNKTVTSMVALDGLGFYSNEPGSQSYPVPGIGFFYPKTANFIGFVTRFKDTALLRKTSKAFRKQATIPSEAAALPAFVPGASWSDHWSFWQHNIPALLVTDTLPFRDPAYHTANDTPARLNYDQMARVTIGLRGVVKALAN